MRHLDLAVLMAFGVSVAFFNDANIDVSVPLAYPLLVYLLARMLWIGLRRGRRRDPLRLMVPASWLVIGLLFLVGFRIGLNVADSNVIDVGYAGVIGADRLADGDRLYGGFPKDNEHGDTYGPVTYAAYVPFEQVLPWSGRWDDCPRPTPRRWPSTCCAWPALPHRPAHARPDARPGARVRLGGESVHALRAGLQRQRRARRRARPRGHRCGVVARRARRFIALAGMAKFAPLALAPLFATYTRGARASCSAARLVLVPCRCWSWATAACTLLRRTLGFQASRGSPFSSGG